MGNQLKLQFFYDFIVNHMIHAQIKDRTFYIEWREEEVENERDFFERIKMIHAAYVCACVIKPQK